MLPSDRDYEDAARIARDMVAYARDGFCSTLAFVSVSDGESLERIAIGINAACKAPIGELLRVNFDFAPATGLIRLGPS